MAGRFVEPAFDITPFTCPNCDTLAPQESGMAGVVNSHPMGGVRSEHFDATMYLTFCTSCEKKVVWARLPDYKAIIQRLKAGTGEPAGGDPEIVSMVYPRKSNAPDPNDDLPEDIKVDYREAAAVLAASPRSAAALLRLCLQKLCVKFGQPGRNINDEIGAMVKAGTIRPMIQKAMDTVRISANESVHPGELNITDDRELALALFNMINLIAFEAITQENTVQAMYEKMPEAKRQGVVDRDRSTG